MSQRLRARGTTVCRCFAVLLVFAAGCGGPSGRSTPAGPGSGQGGAQWQKERFRYAIDNLNRLEEFDVVPAPDRSAGPLMATCPEPPMLVQIIEKLNQWARSQPPPDWTLDPLVATLPEPLRDLPMLKTLADVEFSRYDGFALREAVCLRDVSLWARGDELDDLSRAGKLFDWTVRNIQLEGGGPRGDDAAGWVPQMPWETLMFGRGTALDRAWVFILLARQQRLDAALLAIAGTGPSTDDGTQEPRPWAVAVLSEGELYLFDPRLGLPIPAPDGVHRDSAGQLAIRPATLAQVAADESLLRRLDAGAAHLYPVKAADLKRVVALVESSPAALSRRMKLVEQHLAGEQEMALTAAPSAQAERLTALPHLSDARLWLLPYETLRSRLKLSPRGVDQRLADLAPFYVGGTESLLRGRALYLKGKLIGQEDSAARYLQMARLSEKDIAKIQDARRNDLYQQELPGIQNLPESQREAALQQARVRANQLAAVETAFRLRARYNASYWLGLIAYERANYPTAVDYLAKRTLDAVPDGPWTQGATYNLGRACEAAGQFAKAVAWYQSDADSPATPGNLLRARWLASAEAQPKQRSSP